MKPPYFGLMESNIPLMVFWLGSSPNFSWSFAGSFTSKLSILMIASICVKIACLGHFTEHYCFSDWNDFKPDEIGKFYWVNTVCVCLGIFWNKFKFTAM